MYIKKITGVETPVKPDTVPAKGKVIYVGDTRAALNLGIDSSKLGSDEWVLKSIDNGLVINGGHPRGNIYGVYHYLEDFHGVRFWNYRDETVPKTEAMRLIGIDYSGKPAMEERQVYSLYIKDSGKYAAKLRVMSATEAYYGQIDWSSPDNFGMQSFMGPPNFIHSFDKYFPVEKYYDKHPEWFTLVNGKRIGGGIKGNLCLTNPELRQEFLKKLKEFIKMGREEAKKHGVPYPVLYDISQNDNGVKCECANCRAIAKKYKAESGVYIEFINWLADNVKDEFPEVIINTAAYIHTEKPPVGIVPRDNVSITLVDTVSNILLPYSPKENKYFYETLAAWSKITKHLRVWVYGITYAKPNVLPFPSEFQYGKIIKTLIKNNVKGTFFEYESAVLGDNWDYKLWMWSKLNENPDLDVNSLLNEYANGYYGAAGKYFVQYRTLLAEKAKEKRTYVHNWTIPGALSYLDLDTCKKASALFDSGAEALEGDETMLKRWNFARLALDRAILARALFLKREYILKHNTLQGYPFNAKEIAARIDKTIQEQKEFRSGMLSYVFKLAMQDYNEEKGKYTREIPEKQLRPPAKFAYLGDGGYFDIPLESVFRFKNIGKIVKDDSAESGIAIVTPRESSLCWGLYSPTHSRHWLKGHILWNKLTTKYQWLKLGTAKLVDDCYLYLLPSWILQFPARLACNPMKPDAEYEIWINVRLVPENETSTPSFAIERMIIVPKK